MSTEVLDPLSANSETSTLPVARGASEPVPWDVALAKQIRASGVEVVTYVPDFRLRGVAAALEGHVPVHALTREEECIGFACGYRAAGGRPLVMMQSSGVGNSLNAIGSLAVPFTLSFPIVVTMRGTMGERNPSQVPIGRAAAPLLEVFGIQCYRLTSRDQIDDVVPRVFALAFETGTPAAVLLETTL